MKNAHELADVMERFANAIDGFATELRDVGDKQPDPGYGDDDDLDGAQEAVGREVPADHDTSEDTILQVPAGDLWRLVNRSRKMIRLAREGKIPNMDQRGPLRDAIRALKAQGLVRKPHNLRA